MADSRMKRTETPTSRWEGVVSGVVEMMIEQIVKRCGAPEGNAVRAEVIDAFRVALGPTPTDELVQRMADATGADDGNGGKDLGGMPGLVRLVIEEEVPDWEKPGRAESIMVVAQRALDTEFRRKLAGFAAVVATAEWHLSTDKGMQHRDAMIDRVMEHARGAIAGDATSLVRDVKEDRAVYSTLSGSLRMIVTAFDLNNPIIVRSLLKIIEDAAREELTKATPGQQAA